MSRIVVLQDDRLTTLTELTEEGLDFYFRDGVLCRKDTGDLEHPFLRLRQTGDKASVVRLAPGPPVLFEGRPVEGASLGKGECIRCGDVSIYFWTDEADGDSMSEADLRLLFSLTRDLSLVDFDRLLARMLDRLMEVFNSERGFILLKNRRSGKLEQAVSSKIPESEMGEAASRTVIKRVLRERHTVSMGDAGSELSDARSVRADGIRSVVAAPLQDEDEVFGVVYLDSRAMRKIYTPRELKLLDAFTEHVSQAIRTALERNELERDVKCLKALRATDERNRSNDGTLIGHSLSMRRVMAHVRDVAGQDTTVLVLGESGTGKELVARAIHNASPRRGGPFVAVNCMALSREVTESELFGHEKGAFTGALEQRIGRFEMASGGTIFLDEIGELDHDIQVKLLRVLEERKIERVGGNSTVDLDVRVVAATNRNLKTEVAEGRFREDLYYRLNVFAIELPPLRDRAEDIPDLVEHFVTLGNAKMGRKISGCSAAALEALKRYHWPGNIRELRNVIERAFILEKDDLIGIDSLPSDIGGATGDPSTGSLAGSPARAAASMPQAVPLASAREAFEIEYMRLALERHDGNVARAAKELGVPRSTIYRKFSAAGIDPKSCRSGMSSPA